MNACSDTIINCPLNGDCNVNCNWMNSCRDIKVINNSTTNNNNTNIQCIADFSCLNSQINCAPNNNQCNVNCFHYKSCEEAEIICQSEYGNCNILCNGTSSCHQTVITTFAEYGTFNIDCIQQSACSYININGGETKHDMMNINCAGSETQSCAGANITCPDTGNCGIICSGTSYSCGGSRIECPSVTGNCDIICNEDRSCSEAKVIAGSSNGLLNMECSNGASCESMEITANNDQNIIIDCSVPSNTSYHSSCRYATIDARYASELLITGCDLESFLLCNGMTVYCPENDDGEIKCTLTGTKCIFVSRIFDFVCFHCRQLFNNGANYLCGKWMG